MGYQQNLSLEDRLREIEAAEEQKLERAGGSDREVYDATQLRKQNTQKAMELAEKERALNWQSLELEGFREVKAEKERIEQVKAIGSEFNLTPKYVDKLTESGLTDAEQLKFFAKELATIHTTAKPPTPAPAKGVATGGSQSWEATKKAWAEGKCSVEDYQAARKESGLK
jgi:hypothetical protein